MAISIASSASVFLFSRGGDGAAFALAAALEDDVNAIRHNISRMDRECSWVQDQSFMMCHAAVNVDNIHKMRECMERHINIMLLIGYQVKSQIEGLIQTLASSHYPIHGFDKASVVNMLRESDSQLLGTGLQCLINRFGALRSEFREENEKAALRRYREISGNEADRETLVKLLWSTKGQELVRLAGSCSGNRRAESCLSEIVARRGAVREIEARFGDLCALFAEILMLAAPHGEEE